MVEKRKLHNQIAENLHKSLKELHYMNVMYEKVGRALNLGRTSVIKMMKPYDDRERREITAIEILLLENELGIDRDNILGWRSKMRPNRNILREFDEIMLNDDPDVSDELRLLLLDLKNKIQEMDNKNNALRLCVFLRNVIKGYPFPDFK